MIKSISYAVLVIIMSIVVWQRGVSDSPFWNDGQQRIGEESVSADGHSYGANQPPSLGQTQGWGHLPLSFEANQGQADKGVKFLSRGTGYELILTSDEAVLALSPPINFKNDEERSVRQGTSESNTPQSDPSVLRMRFVGSNPAPELTGVEALPGKNNYLIGNDPAKWHTQVPTYARVRYEDVYPGIDLDFYGNQRQLEYDFVVAPGANPDLIELNFDGADSIELNGDGDLVLKTPGGEIKQHKPVVYQLVNGIRKSISADYVVDDHRVLFQLAEYDHGETLIIDPILSYSSYWGGFAQSQNIAVDSDGNVYITGDAASSNLTTTAGALQTSFLGESLDAFVTKINADGSAVVYSTFLGGSADDESGGIAVDSSGSVYVVGKTSSDDFPVTVGAAQTTRLDADGYVARLNASGSALVYATYLGGTGEDQLNAIAVDSDGNAYVTGSNAGGEDFPTTTGAFQTSNPGGEADLGFQASAFATKINSEGSSFVYSTFLGGEAGESAEGIAVDSSGNAYITGFTASPNFPTTTGAAQVVSGSVESGSKDAFMTKLNSEGSALLYSTFLGGSDNDGAAAIALDPSGNAYVVVGTLSGDFPVTSGALKTTVGDLAGCRTFET